jgi:hypothetical protein
MLKAQFKNVTKGGVCYKVTGSPEELQAYMLTIPAEYSASHITEDGNPLLYAGFAMPGKKDAMHPLHLVQTGPNAGRYCLDTSELRYAEMQMKAFKNEVLADKMANSIVADLRGTISTSVLSRVQVAVTSEDETDLNKVD